MNFVQNILWNSIEGFVEAGTRTAGGYAGDALLKAGDLIEGAGRNVGNGMLYPFPSHIPFLSSFFFNIPLFMSCLFFFLLQRY